MSLSTKTNMICAENQAEAIDSNQEKMPGAGPGIESQHAEYLLQRHGTVELDPVPTMSDADPYNWPVWKKTLNLVLVAFHAMMGTFTAASIIPAYLNISIDLGVSIPRTSYLTSLQIAILGGAPLIWRPLASRFGCRPIFLVTLIGSLLCNIGCAKSPTYGSMAACRALVAFFISPAGALGSAVVTQCFFKHERARFMGVWTMLITVGVPLAPFIFGFVVQRVSYRWIYWILAMINGVQFVSYVFLGSETLYKGEPTFAGFGSRRKYLVFSRLDPAPFTAYEFIKPLTLVTHMSVTIPAIAYATIFLFGSVMCTVEIPQLLQVKFDLDAQGLGLQFIALIIGSVLGEQIGGLLSDKWMSWKSQRQGHRPASEYRLWLNHAGCLITLAGIIVFLIQTQNAPAGKWNITPIVGVAIAAFGNQIVTTVLITYAVDVSSDSASVGVYITFVRQMWGFIGPFWFPYMFDNVGIAKSAGVAAALIVSLSNIPTLLLHWRGPVWRSAQRGSTTAV